MKKFLFIFLSLIFVSRLYAHEIKFMLGGNISKYEISPEVYYGSVRGYEFEYTYEISNTKGFLFGCGIEFALTRNVSIEIDGLYFQKGSSIQKLYSPLESPLENLAIIDLLLSYNLEGISIPLLLKIKFLSGSSPYILGGGEFSFILSHGVETIFDDQTEDWVSKKEFTCPGAPQGPCNYAMNKNVEKLGMRAPPDMVVLFETHPGWNQSGGPEILSTENHNGDGCNVLFVDSHVQFVRTRDLKDLKW